VSLHPYEDTLRANTRSKVDAVTPSNLFIG
jgi:hypothetical protein